MEYREGTRFTLIVDDWEELGEILCEIACEELSKTYLGEPIDDAKVAKVGGDKAVYRYMNPIGDEVIFYVEAGVVERKLLCDIRVLRNDVYDWV